MHAKMTATTFEGLDRIVGQDPLAAARKIGNNTTAERDRDGSIVVRLHGHQIVTLTPSTVTLTDAGWPTPTTFGRLRSFAPGGVRIWSDRGTRKVRTRGDVVTDWTGSVTVPV